METNPATYKLPPGLATMYDWSPTGGLSRKRLPDTLAGSSPFSEPTSMRDSLFFQAGRGLRSYLTNTPLQQAAGGPRAAGTLMGLLGGIGVGGLRNWASPTAPVDIGGYGLAGGLAGWLMGGLNGMPHLKRASFNAPDIATLQRMIQQLQDIPPGVQQQMAQAVATMTPDQRVAAYRVLGAAAGAGAGMMAAKYFSDQGLIPSIVGAILGGLLGFGLGNAAAGSEVQPRPDNSFMFQRGNNPSPGIARLIYGP